MDVLRSHIVLTRPRQLNWWPDDDDDNEDKDENYDMGTMRKDHEDNEENDDNDTERTPWKSDPRICDHWDTDHISDNWEQQS